MNQERNERMPRTPEEVDLLLLGPTGLLSGLQAQRLMSELLEELYCSDSMNATIYADGRTEELHDARLYWVSQR